MLAAVNLITAVPAAVSTGVTHPPAAQANRTAASSPFAASSHFTDLITETLGQQTQLEAQAQTRIISPITSSKVALHQTLIATQNAGQAFELTLAVRNQAVQAYQSVMAMQF